MALADRNTLQAGRLLTLPKCHVCWLPLLAFSKVQEKKKEISPELTSLQVDTLDNSLYYWTPPVTSAPAVDPHTSITTHLWGINSGT